MIHNLHFFVQWSAERNSSNHGWNVNDATHNNRWRHFKYALITALLHHNSKTIRLVGTTYNIYQIFGLDGRP